MIKKALSHYRQYMGATLSSGSAAGNSGQIAKIAEMRALREELRAEQPDSLALRGFKVCSQNDEDGIIAAIFDAVGGANSFLEIGVSDGTECNSHYLFLQGWKGAWVEADDTYAAKVRDGLGGTEFPGRFKLFHDYARTDNIVGIYRETCKLTGQEELDFFSLDIDGNDLFVLDALLTSGARPSVICVEYNGKFPPPLNISVARDETRGWDEDDYFGASLQAFADLLLPAGYALVGCNLSGTNAFFVRNDRLGKLASIPIARCWQPLRLYVTILPAGHVPTLKYMRDILHR